MIKSQFVNKDLRKFGGAKITSKTFHSLQTSFFLKENLKVGSIVLIREENISLLKLPLGVVIELFPGIDGIVRSVLLRTARGFLTRPIQLLEILEIRN